MSRFICPVYDSTFKYLWKDKECRKWFIKLIKFITDIDLNEYTLYDPNADTGNKKKKYKFDIFFIKGATTIHEADIFNIEMYKNYSKMNEIKSNTYIFYLMGSSYVEGEKYTERKGIQVNFHDYLCQRNEMISISKCMIRDDNNDIVKDDITIYDIYLPKYEGICYNGKNEMESMLSLLHCKSYEEMITVANNNKEALNIVEKLEDLSVNEQFLGVYDADKVHRKEINTAKAEGIEEGLELGREEEKLENAINLIKAGYDIEGICNSLNLDINKLKEKLENNK